MLIAFEPARLDDLRGAVVEHLKTLPSAIDSFLEDHIHESAHYKVLVSSSEAGFASVHQGGLLTQFALAPAYKHYGQTVFQQVKKLEEVQAALVPTCDEFFLAHALDEYRQLTKQAYLFGSSASSLDVPPSFALRQAEASDAERVREGSGDFFGDLVVNIGKGRVFLVFSEDTLAAFGVIHESELQAGVASIGMFVVERFRKQGIGTATLQLLQRECRRRHLRAVAGCWYYNHLSKRTLERAGMFAQTRLLKIDF